MKMKTIIIILYNNLTCKYINIYCCAFQIFL